MSEPPADSEVRLSKQCRLTSGGHCRSVIIPAVARYAACASVVLAHLGWPPVVLKLAKAGAWQLSLQAAPVPMSSWHHGALLQQPISLLAHLAGFLPECWVLGHLP